MCIYMFVNKIDKAKADRIMGEIDKLISLNLPLSRIILYFFSFQSLH